MKFLPNAKYLLIEANNAHENGLNDFTNEYKNAEYLIAAASYKEGKVYFDNSDLFGGLASETHFEYNCIEVQSCTIDNEVIKRKLKPPFLIKLDTHGYEKQIIQGALNSIQSAELLIIETYNFKLTQKSLKYYQLCEYMDKLGFSSIEMTDFVLRKYDNSFWQMDTFFIPSSRKEFSHNSYS